MLQFYFLSIVANLVAGMTLSSEWLAEKIPTLGSVVSTLSSRRAKLASGLSSLLVGFAKLFIPVAGPLIIGNLFPAIMGMAMGITLLFEVFRQDAVLPAEQAEKTEKLIRYRTTLGMLGIAAAILHFFLPERLFL